jgi:uncharacterized protein involved in exopolysaccharide biosynthesis
MEPGYSPREVFEYALHHVWLIVVLTLFGGLIGLGVHLFQKPVYEATAIFNISFDFRQTGGMTQLEEDHTWDGLGFLIKSSAVYDRVAQQAEAAHLPITRAELPYRLSTERQETIYFLRVRDTNPQVAAALTNLWAAETKKQFDDARAHALKADGLQRYMYALEGCLESAPARSPADGLCQVSRLTDVQALMASTYAELIPEKDASRNILPAVTYTLSQNADVPTRPVAYGMNSMVLAGALIGLFISIAIIAGRIPEKLAKGRRHA